MINKRVWNAVLGYHLKNDRMTSVHFQGKSFNIMVIQAYTPTSNTEEAEVEWFYEDLQDLLELTPKKKKRWCNMHISQISSVTIYSLDVLLFQFGIIPLFHVWF